MALNGALVTLSDFLAVPPTGMTPVLWNHVIYDNQRISQGLGLTVPSGVTLVKIFFQAKWDWDQGNSNPAQASGFRIASVRKNNSDNTILPESRMRTVSGTPTSQNGSSPPIQVIAEDTFELWVGQNSGMDIKLVPNQTWFAMEILETLAPTL